MFDTLEGAKVTYSNIKKTTSKFSIEVDNKRASFSFHCIPECSFLEMLYILIRKTCPCNEYPIKPKLYILKVGYAGVYLFFLFFLQNIDCGYSLEPPRRGSSNRLGEAVLTCTHNLCFEQNKKYIKIFPLKTFNFYNLGKSVYYMGVFS